MSNRIINFMLLSLAGKLIGNVVTNKNVTNKNSMKLPSFKGVLEIKHSMSGRIRFSIPLLKENEEAKQVLVEQLSKVPAISKLEISLITGSLLICFDEKVVDPAILIGAIIKILGLEDQIGNRPEALATTELKNIKESINMAIYEKSNGILDGKSLFILLTLISGVKMIKGNPTLLPNGYTLLRWGATGI